MSFIYLLTYLAMKVGVCLEHAAPPRRAALLNEAVRDYAESGEMGHVRSPEHLLQLLLAGGTDGRYLFTPGLVGALCETCEMVRTLGLGLGLVVGLGSGLDV